MLAPHGQMATVGPRVYVIVLNWNGSTDTQACVQSVLAMDHPNLVVLVCDNDSRATDLAALRAWGGRLEGGLPEISAATAGSAGRPLPLQTRQVLLMHTGANLGFAGGVNAGLRFALRQGDLDFAWVLNNDTEVDPNALAALQTRMARGPDIGICGSTLIYHGDRSRVQALGGARYLPWRGRSIAIGAFSSANAIPTDRSAVERQMDYVVGASMLVSRRFLDVVGLMDERYFLYSEEHDWAHRGRKAGFALGWAPDSLVFHKHGATIGSSASGGSPLSMFYLYRSKALFIARHYPWRLPIALCWLVFDAAKFAVKGQPAKSWAALRGLLAFPRLGRF